jgi:hypothetical protein
MAKPRATVWPLATSIRQPLVRHGQAVQVAAVVGRQRREERRPPARHKAVLAIERTQAAEGRVDQPEFPLTLPSPAGGERVGGGPGQLVGLNLAREVGGACQEAGVVPAGGFDAGGNVGRGLHEPDLRTGGNNDAVGRDGHSHRALEVVVRQRQLPIRDPDGGDLARLIGGHEQRDAELAQQRRQRARVLVANFTRGRSALLF